MAITVNFELVNEQTLPVVHDKKELKIIKEQIDDGDFRRFFC